MHSQRNRPTKRGKWAFACLTVYWLALFLATHWPNPWAGAKKLPHADNTMHSSSYAVLGLLLSAATALSSRTDTRSDRKAQLRRYLRTWLIVAAYGLFDETTQPLTGRDFEWLDWVADMSGGASGILTFAVLRMLWAKFR